MIVHAQIKYIHMFCNYIKIVLDEFWNHVDEIINKDLLERVDGKWIPSLKSIRNL